MTGDRGQAWVAVGALLVAVAQGQPVRQKPKPICEGQPVGGACWMKLDSHPECYVWEQSLKQDESLTWTGSCTAGRADGLGVLKLAWRGTPFRVVEVEGAGLLRSGKMDGPWTERFVGGGTWKGLYLDGKRHGHWVERYVGGAVHEGPYMDGKRHGRWVVNGPDPDSPTSIQIWTDGTLTGSFGDSRR